MNQLDIVLRELKRRKRKGLTQRDVLSLGIFRLGARIHDLRSQGYPIQTEIKKDRNQYGHVVKFACYKLVQS